MIIPHPDSEEFFVLGARHEHAISSKNPGKVNEDDVEHLLDDLGEEDYCLYLAADSEGKECTSAAISKEIGYSLALCLHAYIGKARYVWCEKVKEGFAVVAALDGRIVIDSVFNEHESDRLLHSISDFSEQPCTLLGTMDTHPQIIELIEEGKHFQFVDERTKSSLLEFLTLDDQYLIGVEAGHSSKSLLLAVAIAVLVIVIGAVVFAFSSKEIEVPNITIPILDPYAGYRDALGRTAASEAISSIRKQVEHSLGLSTWHISLCNYSGSDSAATCTASPKSVGQSPLAEIVEYADHLGLKVAIDQQEVHLSLPIIGKDLGKGELITRHTVVARKIHDDISLLFDNSLVKIHAAVEHNKHWGQKALTVDLSDIHIDDLSILSEQLRGLPVSISELTLTGNKDIVGQFTLSTVLITYGSN